MRNLGYAAIMTFSLLTLVGCGGGSGGRDGNLVGTWVADRIVGEEASTGNVTKDADMSTIIYREDGTGEVRAEADLLDILWDTEDGQITSEIPAFDATMSSDYDISGHGDILTTTTVLADGATVTETYYRLSKNQPAELIGTWVPTGDAAASGGRDMTLHLQAGESGSNTWGVTEDRLLVLEASTLQGHAFEFTLDDTVTPNTLTITEENDFGKMVIPYKKVG